VNANAASAEWETGRLDSWKEIASFFRREVRTVQLWEKSEGLPVRRQHHKKLGSVYAYRRELEAWWLARSALSGHMTPPAAPTAQPGGTEQSAAYHACMIGLHFWKQRTRTGLMKALGYYHEAILIDPSCAEAYAGLTDTYVELSYSHFMPAREAAQEAQRAVSTALKLAPRCVNVRNAEINFNVACKWDWRTAQRLCQHLVDSGAADSRTLQLYASLMICLGRPEEAIRLALSAHRLDPLSDCINSQASFAYFYAGDYDRAIPFIDRTISLKPSFNTAHALMGRTEAQRGNWDKAIESFERGLAGCSSSTFLKALLAYGYAGRGDATIAREILREIEQQRERACFPAVDVSAVYAMLNQQQEALHYISRAYDLRDMKVAYIRYDPRFSRLRGLPQFRKIASSFSAC
jgi:serine/threonine-protein kinase